MTEQQIQDLFIIEINKKRKPKNQLYDIVPNVTENKVYNWKKKRTIPTLGEMLNLLYILEIIKITPNEPARKSL